MKRPMLPVALLYAAGVLCQEYAHPAPLVLFAAAFLTATLALASARGRPWLLGLLLILTGWTGACWRSAVLAPDDLRSQLGRTAVETRVRGRILAPVAQRIFERGGRELSRSSILIQADGIFLGGAWQPAFGKVIATVPGVPSPEFFEGQSVEVAGVIRSPDGPLAQGLFDARAYYARQNVFYQLQAASTNDIRLAGQGVSLRAPLSERFRRWSMKTLALGLPVEDEPLRLTWTLLLDWKAPLTVEVEEPFMRAGTYHILAVDGLRMWLLAGIGLGLLRLLQLPRPVCGAIILPVLWFYADLTGWPASAIRATIMLTIVIAGWALRRPQDLLNSLFAAAEIILIWQPEQLFQAGFQLSFLVVACIAVIVPRVNDWLQRKLFRGDPMLPDTLQPRWPGFLHVPAKYMIDTFSVSFAAWVGSIPLAAYYFHLFTPVSIVANCAVVPATALALVAGIGSLLAGGWWPGLAALFNNSAWALMKFILAFSRWAAVWRIGNFNAAAPSVPACAFYYALLFMVVTGWIFRSRFKVLVSAVMVVVGACLAVHWALARQTAHIHVLPLKGSPVLFVDSPGTEDNLLVDCADTESADRVLKPFLGAQGVNRLPALALAVGLLPHFGGVTVIMANFSVGRIFVPAAPNRSPSYRNLMLQFQPVHVHDADKIGAWTALNPGAEDQFETAEDASLALRRECNGRSILLLPALARSGQDALMRRHPDLRADIVVAGLPTHDEPLCDPLLDMLQARWIIIADAEFPATRRAPQKLRQRLARPPAQVLSCHDLGSLTLDISPRECTIRTADGSGVSGPLSSE